jgi:zinc transporter ZupT
MDELLLLLAFVIFAAIAAVLSGPMYRVTRDGDAEALGWANAMAAGLMLGAAYAIAFHGWGDGPGVGFGLGALLGVIPGIAAYRLADGTPWGARNQEPVIGANHGPTAAYGSILRHAVHAAPEGVAIGVAASMDLGLGLFLAAALATHNVAEGLSLVVATVEDGRSTVLGAGRAVVSNLPQVVLGVGAFLLLEAQPLLTPLGVGFSVGALVYLVLVDLLPEAYHQVGAEVIAIVAAIGMSSVPFLAGILGV